MAQDAQPTMSTYTGDYLHDRNQALPPGPASVTGSSITSESKSDEAAQPSLFELTEAAVRRNPVLAVAAVASVSALAVMALRSRRRDASPMQVAMGDVGDRLRDLERRALPHIRRTERQIQKSLKQSRLADGAADLISAVTSRLSALDSGELQKLKARASEALQQVASKVGTR